MQVELNWRQQAAALIECGSPHAHSMCHGFVAFLWKIPPIWPVLPVVPFHKCFAVNNLRQDRQSKSLRNHCGNRGRKWLKRSIRCRNRYERLREAVEGIGGISLLIIEPIVTAVTGDMHKANDVRRSLQTIVDFCI